MDIAPPPASYDHAYGGRLIERHGTLTDVEQYCHTMQGIVSPYRALGCARVNGSNCFIMIPSLGGNVTARLQAQIRRHEVAHCNGWPANHAP